jgi:sugar phosphate isomerase/epimerase
MTPRISCSDNCWQGLSAELGLELIRELGLDGGTVRVSPRSKWPMDEIVSAPDAWAERIRGEFESRGLGISDVSHNPSATLTALTVNHPDPAERGQSDELFAACVRFASALGAGGITSPPGLVFGGEPWDEAADRLTEALLRRVELAQQHDLRLSVEPHIISVKPYAGSVIDTPERTLALLERVPGLELTLDHGHFAAQGIRDRDVEPLIAHARHVHVRGAAPGFIQTRFEDSAIDYARVLDRLAAVGYDGWLEIEYVYDVRRPGCSNCDTIQEVRKYAAFVREHEDARDGAGVGA